MRRTTASLALAAGLALAAAAQAQPRNRPDGPPDRPSAEEMHARFAAMQQAQAREMAEDLRIVLRLRPEQEGALSAFLAAEGPPQPPHGMGDHPPSDRGALTTPQRLDEIARRAEEHARMRGRRVAALRSFYAALDPAQQKVFDALERLKAPHGPPPFGGRDHDLPSGPAGRP